MKAQTNLRTPPETPLLPAPWQIGAILFTSGTTGPSKAVRLPWAQIVASAKGAFLTEDLTADEVIYSPGPTYHIGAKLWADGTMPLRVRCIREGI